MDLDDRLLCRVLQLSYDFEMRTGHLYMLSGDCCDMRGCINLFKGIDPHVARIQTYSGDDLDTRYHRDEVGWHAVTHNGNHQARRWDRERDNKRDS